MRRYAILDVFTDRPLAGNPLAVVLDAEGLDAARMQAVAAEFNLSETVFVLPAENPVHSARLRIFTPAAELPFAGHPTVGTAVLLAGERNGGGRGLDAMVILEEKVGPVRCAVALREGGGEAIFDLPRLPREVERTVSRDAAAAALGLAAAEIGFENHLPTVFDAGVPFVFVPVRNLAAIAKARPNPAAWPGLGGPSAYVYTRETMAVGRQFHARMFWPGAGIAEDPATGAAAAALAGVAHKFDAHPSGLHRMIIEQGFEMGRPSLIRLEIDVEAGTLAGARIGGAAVILARGELALD